jgi:uncharacterized membrane protein YczE
MFIGSFLIQYFVMPAFMIENFTAFTNNIGKIYVSVLMGLFMILLEVMMHDHQYNVVSKNIYLIIAFFIALFIYLYRKQVAINDTQYLEGMIEHHSMALLTSKQIVEKTNNYDVSKLSKNIIQTQQDEINEMREIIQKLKSENKVI